MENIRLSRRLFFKQARNAIVVALLLGIAISLSQIFYDFQSEKKRIDQTVMQVINTTRESASQAAYNLNSGLALRVVRGLFEYRPIYFAQINDDFGRQLASLERATVKTKSEWLELLIGSEDSLYKIPLYLNDKKTLIGEMQVRIDRFLIAQTFLERAGLLIFSGFVRNFILAIIFCVLFYFTLGRPVMQMVSALSSVDPEHPGKAHFDPPKGHEDNELGLLTEKLNTILADFQTTLERHDQAEEELRQKQQMIQLLNLRLEERVKQRTSELEAANKEMEAFTYSASHDLRAPLRAIDGFSSILQDEYANQLDEQAHHYLERVRASTQKMETLINDLLKLSRSTRGELHRSTINLSNLAEEITEDLKNARPDQTIDIHISPNMHAKADKRFIRLVLENLFSNAWKYTHHKEIPEITFSKTVKDGQDVFFISDNGAGFDMNYADRLFSPFQRLHSNKEFEGTGVGLATVQRIIHRHGGEVWARAEVDQGATFYFTIPALDDVLLPTIDDFEI